MRFFPQLQKVTTCMIWPTSWLGLDLLSSKLSRSSGDLHRKTDLDADPRFTSTSFTSRDSCHIQADLIDGWYSYKKRVGSSPHVVSLSAVVVRPASRRLRGLQGAWDVSAPAAPDTVSNHSLALRGKPCAPKVGAVLLRSYILSDADLLQSVSRLNWPLQWFS